MKNVPWKILYDYTSYVDNYCANDQINSLGPKGSIETNNSKNSCFHDDKSFWPFFPRIIECDKHQGFPDFIRLQRYPDKYFKKDKINSLGLMMSIETNIFKKSCFQDHKSFWPVFPPYIACERPHGTTFKGPQAILTIFWKIKKRFLGTRGCWKHKVVKNKATYPVEKRLWPLLFRFIEHGNWQGTIYTGPQGVLTSIVQMIITFLWHLRGQ